MKTYDLGWGESVAVRQAFLKVSNANVNFDFNALSNLGYPKHEGEPELIELTRQIIKRQTGNHYNHILITNGATGGVTIALRSFCQSRGIKECVTRKPPYFRLYPHMIRSAGMYQTYEEAYGIDRVFLVDSLSNPLGTFSEMKKDSVKSPIIWDSVYYGNVYAPGNHPQPDHDVLVGSYSKLTGLNGLRIGWIACNDPSGYEKMKNLVTAEYCGISATSTKIVMETVGKLSSKQWEEFEYKAQLNLDYNREEFSKLEKFFGDTPVGKYGMFYYAPIDGACLKLLIDSGIVWSPGSHLGDTNDFARFNIGQDVKLIKEAVATILKNDRR